jgi:ABC-type transport system involved in multi-copper enzyme maturation permease subunit
MIWLSWRQFRTQAWVALGALVALAAFLLILGRDIRHAANTQLVGCGNAQLCAAAERAFRNDYDVPLTLVGALVIVAPALIGAFWGAPLITRELETGTHQLVWNQSVTRTHWLVVKLAIIGVAGLLLTASLSILLTWAARPYDDRVSSRFTAFTFGSRNLAPVGYTLFALALGVAIGLIVRRTLPALALTLAVFAVVQIVIPFVVRPHLIPAETTSVAVNATSLGRIDMFGYNDKTLEVQGYAAPGDWVIHSGGKVLDATGKVADGHSPAIKKCMAVGAGGPELAGACLAKLDLHFDITYQPAHRYWPFQWIETAVFSAMGLTLTGLSLWRIRRDLT